MVPIIFHLDMNSYFASCEQQDNVLWRGKPLGVCEHLGGIIIAASREAKKIGITTGTPVWQAKKIFPKVILTHTRPERYRYFTRKFIGVVSDYTNLVEKYSIDEVFLDMTKACNVEKVLKGNFFGTRTFVDPWQEAVKIAKEIKFRFKTEVGDFLTCSIGISENKLLSKIASDMQKPDGLVIILPNTTQVCSLNDKECLVLLKNELYNRLELIDVPGIGIRQEKNLKRMGIFTLKDLRDYPKSRLIAQFGLMGHHLHNMGQLSGSFKSAVHDEKEIKSMGHMYTLPQEFRKPEFFAPVLYKLCEMVARRLRRQDLMGNIIHFYIYGKNNEGFGKSHKLGYFVRDGKEIFAECMAIVEKEFSGDFSDRAVRFVGVTVAGLQPYFHQLSLFKNLEQQNKIMAALDAVNEKYGEFTLLRAQMLKAGRVFRDSIGFGRMKELGEDN